MSWHMSQKVIAGLIISVGASLVMSSYQFFWVVRSLDTNPPIVERIITLELKASEYGRLMARINLTLDELNKTMDKIHQEQSRRKPMVDYVEKQLNNGGYGIRGERR